MTSDPYLHYDGAYVLGALSDADRDAFEDHLTTCDSCRARVDELSELPSLMSGITADEVAAMSGPDEPVPDTLLPRLMRAASTRRRRMRVLVGGLAAVAAACLVALMVVLWPSSSSSPPKSQAMTPIGAVPISATVRLVPKAWGTEIDVLCRYTVNDDEPPIPYSLVVFDRHGNTQSIGTWSLTPGHDADFSSPTYLRQSQIAKLEIQIAGARPVLRLTPQ